MKRVFLVLSIILSVYGAGIADEILKKDGEVIEGKIEKVAENQYIHIRKADGKLWRILWKNISNYSIVDKDNSILVVEVEADNNKEKPAINKSTPPSNDDIKEIPSDLLEKYNTRKLSIRTLDVYNSVSTQRGSSYYSSFFNTIFDNSEKVTTSAPKQKWAITQGGIDITDIKFLSLVDPEKGKKIELKIEKNIKELRDGAGSSIFLGVIGSIATLIGCFPLDSYTIHYTYIGNQTYTSYGTTNYILLGAGGLLAYLGFNGARIQNEQADAVQGMKIDPLIHFNTIEYTRDNIQQYNEELKFTLNIKF